MDKNGDFPSILVLLGFQFLKSREPHDRLWTSSGWRRSACAPGPRTNSRLNQWANIKKTLQIEVHITIIDYHITIRNRRTHYYPIFSNSDCNVWASRGPCALASTQASPCKLPKTVHFSIWCVGDSHIRIYQDICTYDVYICVCVYIYIYICVCVYIYILYICTSLWCTRLCVCYVTGI